MYKHIISINRNQEVDMQTGKDNKKNRVTVNDIAKASGISIATVSRAVNHPELVNGRTAARIQAAMNELGYSPRNNSSLIPPDSLLINIQTPVNSFYAKVIEGIAASAKLHGYRVLINQDVYDSDEKIGELARRIKLNNIKGIVFINALSSSYFSNISEMVPLVQCLEPISTDYSCVSIDNQRAVYSIMEHLFRQGKRNIVFLNGPQESIYAKERQDAFISFMELNSLALRDGQIINLPSDNYDMALSTFVRLLSSSDLPEAVFAVSDLMAAAVINAARICRIDVPEQMLVAGFNNDDYSMISQPKITTVSQPLFNIGYTAGEILYEYVSNRTSKPTRFIRLDTELIIRESTMAPISGQN